MPIPSIAIVRLFTLGSANTRTRNICNFNHVISFSTSRSQQQWIVWRTLSCTGRGLCKHLGGEATGEKSTKKCGSGSKSWWWWRRWWRDARRGNIMEINLFVSSQEPSCRANTAPGPATATRPPGRGSNQIEKIISIQYS